MAADNGTGSQLFDALDPATLAGLRDSVQRLGVLVPIAKDQDGNVLDGHHRIQVADELGVKYRVDVIQCADEQQRDEIRRTLNVDRRQLSGDDLKRHILTLAQLREPSGVGALSQTEIAERAGVDHTYVGQVLRGPEVGSTPNLPTERRGKDGKVYKAARPAVVTAKDEHEADQAQLALAALPDDHVLPPTSTAPEAARAAARLRVPEPAITPGSPDTTAGQFRCVVIDPPWPIEKIERDERPNQGQALDYPTMPVWCQRPELVDLGEGTDWLRCWEKRAVDQDHDHDGVCQSIECVVGSQLTDVADIDGCHVYLWTTHRFLPDALALLDRWGGKYQCLMTWRKNVGITPFSWMYDTEHVVFGRFGSLRLNELGLRLSFDAPVNGHSVKPDVFYERVRKASPEPRLDLFTRQPRDGFTAWGNEAER